MTQKRKWGKKAVMWLPVGEVIEAARACREQVGITREGELVLDWLPNKEVLEALKGLGEQPLLTKPE